MATRVLEMTGIREESPKSTRDRELNEEYGVHPKILETLRYDLADHIRHIQPNKVSKFTATVIDGKSKSRQGIEIKYGLYRDLADNIRITDDPDLEFLYQMGVAPSESTSSSQNTLQANTEGGVDLSLLSTKILLHQIRTQRNILNAKN